MKGHTLFVLCVKDEEVDLFRFDKTQNRLILVKSLGRGIKETEQDLGRKALRYLTSTKDYKADNLIIQII